MRRLPLLVVLAIPACTPDILVDGTATGAGGSGGGSASSSSSASTSTSTTATASTGMPGLCGDGVIGPLEQCDDGNMASNDGCSSTCTLEGTSCIDPIDLTVPLGTLTISGTTKSGTNIPNPDPCANVPAAERWFRFQPTEDGFLTVWTEAVGSAAIDTTLYTVSACGGAVASCADNDSGAPDVLSFRVVASSSVLVAIDGHADGPFTLQVDLSKGDDCNDPIPLPLGPPGSKPIHVTADTTGLMNDNNSGAPQGAGCGGTNAPDVVYELMPMGGTEATVTADGVGTMTPVLYHRQDCSQTTTGNCFYAPGTGGIATLQVPLTTPRFLWLDGRVDYMGEVDLVVAP